MPASTRRAPDCSSHTTPQQTHARTWSQKRALETPAFLLKGWRPHWSRVWGRSQRESCRCVMREAEGCSVSVRQNACLRRLICMQRCFCMLAALRMPHAACSTPCRQPTATQPTALLVNAPPLILTIPDCPVMSSSSSPISGCCCCCCCCCCRCCRCCWPPVLVGRGASGRLAVSSASTIITSLSGLGSRRAAPAPVVVVRGCWLGGGARGSMRPTAAVCSEAHKRRNTRRRLAVRVWRHSRPRPLRLPQGLLLTTRSRGRPIIIAEGEIDKERHPRVRVAAAKARRDNALEPPSQQQTACGHSWAPTPWEAH